MVKIKRIISSVIAAMIVMSQALLPFGDNCFPLRNRIIIAISFLTVWIIYIIFSDKIEYFISKTVFHRDLEYKTPKAKYDEFFLTIIPFCTFLNNNIATNIADNFQINSLYNIWCYVINFILNDCCISRKKIDHKIVCTEKETYVANFRNYKIDPKYIRSIIEVLKMFKDSNEKLINNNDVDLQIDRLNTIDFIFAKNKNIDVD